MRIVPKVYICLVKIFSFILKPKFSLIKKNFNKDKDKSKSLMSYENSSIHSDKCTAKDIIYSILYIITTLIVQ